MNSPLFIGHEIYRGSSYGRWHPLRVPRVSTVMDLSRALGWLPKGQFITSPRAKPEALVNWHTADYIDALQRVEADQIATADDLSRHDIGSVTNPVFPEIFRRPATAAGGSILAGELLRDGGVVYNPAGGTHHGMPDRANGFCYLNDPVLAMLSLRRFGIRRIAFVDIDAHHPDGVEAGFGGDPDCLLISVHEARLWPRSGPVENDGGGNALNIAVPRGFDDSEMAFVRDALILPRVEAFEPDAIVLLCGADAVEEDPLSHLHLSNNAHWDILRRLMGMAPRLLVLGGGGYNPWSVGRLWTGIWGILNGQDLPATLPTEAEVILRALRFDGNRRGKNPPEHWFTTLQDKPRLGDVRDEVKEVVRQLLLRPVL
ncbi:acetoin utilization protein AcuC [Sulfitobacter sp. M368]|uniref:acetoin utilization protein AcuC n=1 Tax=Sulfitobacter sp. M368 TaxID=2867021 RepID=UPI0021A3B67D|nr:acetoin utilization protein AcuC [Sulfitobacter sp. M368]UWR15344.1 acetoin utilization protein AcuC [Sulfitobacter sp. M368]